MEDFNAINNALNSSATVPAVAKVSIVALGGVSDYEITPGTSIREIKSRYGLSDMKIVTGDGTVLNDNDTISGDVQLYVSTPKRNG